MERNRGRKLNRKERKSILSSKKPSQIRCNWIKNLREERDPHVDTLEKDSAIGMMKAAGAGSEGGGVRK